VDSPTVIVDPSLQATIDLQAQTLVVVGAHTMSPTTHFPLDPFDKHCLLDGVDQLGYLLKFADRINAYETPSHRISNRSNLLVRHNPSDGTQREGISLSVMDKIKIAVRLDDSAFIMSKVAGPARAKDAAAERNAMRFKQADRLRLHVQKVPVRE
jgi:hypothetical protein